MTLVEFLRARLDEIAEAADGVHRWEGGAQLTCDHVIAYGHDQCTCGWPARLLADVDAKRRIVDAYEAAGAAWQAAVSDPPAATEVIHKATATSIALELAVRNLSTGYADHPDYDPAWRP